MGNCVNCGASFGIFNPALCQIGRYSLCGTCAYGINGDWALLSSATDSQNIQQLYRTFINALNSDTKLSSDTKAKLLAATKRYVGSFTDVQLQEEEPNVREETGNPKDLLENWEYQSRFSSASGDNLPYVVLQVTLKEKLMGTGSGNLEDLEEVINNQVAKGYRLHTMSTSSSDSKGFLGGDRIQATLVFERLDIYRGNLKVE